MRDCLRMNLPRSLQLLFTLGAASAVTLTATVTLSQPANPANGTSGSPTETVTRPTLKSGSKGNEVTELQATLKLLGFYGGSVDGVYGQTTVSAVSSFQQAAGLDADGVTGPATWDRLFPATPLVAAAAPSMPSPNRPVSTVAPVGSSTASKPAQPKPAAGAKPTAKTTPVAAPTTVATASKKPDLSRDESSTVSTEAIFPILKLGMKGPAVAGLQARLRAIGLLKGTADGVFGTETQEAVKSAQRKFKLEADGVVGPATWSELMQ